MTEVTHITEDEMEIAVPAPANPKGKKKVLTPKQQAFLSALTNEAEGDIKKAMELAGYSANTRPEDVLSNMHEEVIEAANKALSSHSIKAVMKLVGVLDKPAVPGNKELIAAAKEILDRVGVFKAKENQGGTTIQADNVFILPPKDTKQIAG